jgi:hypothetical protein
VNAAAIRQCGTVCEWHWFDTDPEHIHQPPRSLVDDEMMKQRIIAWVREGAPDGAEPSAVIGPENPRATLYMFMQDISRSDARKIAEVVATNGNADALEYPLGYLAETIRKMDEETAAEAWELFGQGVKP